MSVDSVDRIGFRSFDAFGRLIVTFKCLMVNILCIHIVCCQCCLGPLCVRQPEGVCVDTGWYRPIDETLTYHGFMCLWLCRRRPPKQIANIQPLHVSVFRDTSGTSCGFESVSGLDHVSGQKIVFSPPLQSCCSIVSLQLGDFTTQEQLQYHFDTLVLESNSS